MRNKDKNEGTFFAATVVQLPPSVSGGSWTTQRRWTVESFAHKLLACYETTIFIGWDHLVRVVLKAAENCLWWSLCPICTYVGGWLPTKMLSFSFSLSLSLLLCKRPKKLAAGAPHEGNPEIPCRNCRPKWLWLQLHRWRSHRGFLFLSPFPSHCYCHWFVSDNILSLSLFLYIFLYIYTHTHTLFFGDSCM